MYANNPELLKGFKVANKDKCEQCHKPRQRDIYDYCYKPSHIKRIAKRSFLKRRLEWAGGSETETKITGLTM